MATGRSDHPSSHGLILDGRNRARACQALGIDVKETRYAGDDPFGFVLSHNLFRRHLTESQRAMVAANLANLRNGQNSDDRALSIDRAQVTPITTKAAAKALNVGEASAHRARSIRDNGTLELIEAAVVTDLSVTFFAMTAPVNTETGEIVQTPKAEIPLRFITADDVRASIKRAKRSFEKAAEEIVWQIEMEGWRTLGYRSWSAMREAEYGGVAFMVPRKDRPELVAWKRANSRWAYGAVESGTTSESTADLGGALRAIVNNVGDAGSIDLARVKRSELARMVELLRLTETDVRHLRQRLEDALDGGTSRACPVCDRAVTGRAGRIYCGGTCRQRARRAKLS